MHSFRIGTATTRNCFATCGNYELIKYYVIHGSNVITTEVNGYGGALYPTFLTSSLGSTGSVPGLSTRLYIHDVQVCTYIPSMLPYSIRQLSSAVYVEMGVVVAYKQILHFFQYMFYMQLWVVLPPGC